MIHIYIFADAYKQFNDAVKEYDKRLWRSCKIIKLKPVKKWTPAQIIAAETELLKQKIEKQNAYKVVLAPGWNSLNTFAFHKLIEDNKQIYPHPLRFHPPPCSRTHHTTRTDLSSCYDWEMKWLS